LFSPTATSDPALRILVAPYLRSLPARSDLYPRGGGTGACDSRGDGGRAGRRQRRRCLDPALAISCRSSEPARRRCGGELQGQHRTGRFSIKIMRLLLLPRPLAATHPPSPSCTGRNAPLLKLGSGDDSLDLRLSGSGGWEEESHGFREIAAPSVSVALEVTAELEEIHGVATSSHTAPPPQRVDLRPGLRPSMVADVRAWQENAPAAERRWLFAFGSAARPGEQEVCRRRDVPVWEL
jgi:hypothetical protein